MTLTTQACHSKLHARFQTVQLLVGWNLPTKVTPNSEISATLQNKDVGFSFSYPTKSQKVTREVKMFINILENDGIKQ